jgi:hypothetical protein
MNEPATSLDDLMEPENIEMKLEEIREWQLEAQGPFPYADCRFLSQGNEQIMRDFIPDLDFWMSKIAGYASWGRRLMKRSTSELKQILDAICLRLIEEHPKYSTIVLAGLNSKDTPDLAEDLDDYEKMRSALFEAIKEMLRDRGEFAAGWR